MRSLLPTIGLTFVIFSGVLGIVLHPGQQQTLVAVFDPNGEPYQVLALLQQLDARIIDGGALPGTVILHSDQPGFSDRLYEAGAWMVFNPLGAAGCTSNDTTKKISGLQSN